ncbi:MAG: hypothetical protein QOE88_2906, partial [Verrucomicrobiota bacterium]|nr:hypothetical protein [Verrucomicrobiota bacterium]
PSLATPSGNKGSNDIKQLEAKDGIQMAFSLAAAGLVVARRLFNLRPSKEK